MTPGKRPKASPLTRFQAANGETALATLSHVMIQIDDASVRALVLPIEETRTREELALDIARRNEISASARLDEIPTRFAWSGLMVG